VSDLQLTAANVAYSLAARMKGPDCKPELMYHPGDKDPSGVLLRYPSFGQVFVCLVSLPKREDGVRDITEMLPLPFPED
jgi:hypothetical protein